MIVMVAFPCDFGLMAEGIGVVTEIVPTAGWVIKQLPGKGGRGKKVAFRDLMHTGFRDQHGTFTSFQLWFRGQLQQKEVGCPSGIGFCFYGSRQQMENQVKIAGYISESANCIIGTQRIWKYNDCNNRDRQERREPNLTQGGNQS